MLKKIVIGNWKMNPQTVKDAEKLFKEISTLTKNRKEDIVVCVPFPYLSNLKKLSKKVKFGAQNVYYEAEGAYTGEVSVKMLKSFGVSFCIVGHSERRKMGETNSEVSKKASSLLKEKIIPIICVGESERSTDHTYLAYVKSQLVESIAGVPKAQMKNIVIAYEPVWAIGKDATRVATAEECMEMVLYIRKVIADATDSKTAHSVRVIYGGSVHPENAKEFIVNGGVDGFLPGRDSLNAKKFLKIIESCNQ